MTAPATGSPNSFVNVKTMVLDCTAWLNVTVIGVDNATPRLAGIGNSFVTYGADVAAVVNVQVQGAVMATPELLLAPLTVAVYVVE